MKEDDQIFDFGYVKEFPIIGIILFLRDK